MNNIRRLFAAFAAFASLFAFPALAQTTMFNFISSEFNLSFSLPASPSPSFWTTDRGFRVSGAGTLNGSPTTFTGIEFGNAANPLGSGGFTYDGSMENYFFGPQVYTGPESAPTFVDGVYNLTRYAGGTPGVLIVSTSAVPEPMAWAMMLAGFLVAGLRLRSRQSATRISPSCAALATSRPS